MSKKKSDRDTEYELLCANVDALAQTIPGKEFIWYVLELCDLYTDTFTGNSQTFYLEGKRAVGLAILQLLEDTDPLLYARLLLERNTDRQNKGEM
jgi:hypothetical protein